MRDTYKDRRYKFLFNVSKTGFPLYKKQRKKQRRYRIKEYMRKELYDVLPCFKTCDLCDWE